MIEQTDRADPYDILLSQRFLPEYGGAVRWMYEAYRRWPRPVHVITHDYYNAPPFTGEFPDAPRRPTSGDHAADPNFTLDRRNIFLHSWGLDSPKRIMRYLRMAQAVRQQLRRHARVYVHCRDVVPEVVSLIPLRRRYRDRLRVICYAHGEELTACQSSRQLRGLLRHACAAVDLMIANSRSTTRLLDGYMDPARMTVVHPGVAFDTFAASGSGGAGQHWRRQQGIDDDAAVVLTVGRLDPRKNHTAVIDAVAKLAPQHPKLVYYIAGVGRLTDELKTQAQRLGVADRVRFAGRIDDQTKLAMYGGCDVFAMPSIETGADIEGFGMVFLEAGAAGKPSIAGRAGGQAEAVLDNETGCCVDGNDHDAVADALGKLLSDQKSAQRMGEKARDHARQFDWPRVVKRTFEVVSALD